MKTTQERFEEKFTKSDGCWEWNACKNSDGYGTFGFAGGLQTAHRFAYQLYVGGIKDGLVVCHRCDNPGCVNPAHLFLGTQADNIRDSVNKGRCIRASGEKSGKSKLTEAQVVKIRTGYSEGTRIVDLAKEFGVAWTTIFAVVHRHTWANI